MFPQENGGARCGLVASNGRKFQGCLISDLEYCPKARAEENGEKLVDISAIDRARLAAVLGMLETASKVTRDMLGRIPANEKGKDNDEENEEDQ